MRFELEFYDYLNAMDILKEKALSFEIEDIIHNMNKIDIEKFYKFFQAKGWETSKQFSEGLIYTWDALKNSTKL